MSTLNPPARPLLSRFGENLAEQWRVTARHDPEYAYVMKFVAEALLDGSFLGAFLNRTNPAPDKPTRGPRLVTGAQQRDAAMQADEWLRSFIEAQSEDSKSPSARVIFAAAARGKDLVLPRRVVDAAIKRQWPLRVRQ